MWHRWNKMIFATNKSPKKENELWAKDIGNIETKIDQVNKKCISFDKKKNRKYENYIDYIVIKTNEIEKLTTITVLFVFF